MARTVCLHKLKTHLCEANRALCREVAESDESEHVRESLARVDAALDELGVAPQGVDLEQLRADGIDPNGVPCVCPECRPAPRAARVSSDTKPCRGCKKPVRWTRTAQGRPMPLDPEPIAVVLEEGGPLKVVLEDGRVMAARRPEGTDLHEPVMARVSHFATCPKADQFRGTGNG